PAWDVAVRLDHLRSHPNSQDRMDPRGGLLYGTEGDPSDVQNNSPRSGRRCRNGGVIARMQYRRSRRLRSKRWTIGRRVDLRSCASVEESCSKRTALVALFCTERPKWCTLEYSHR